jgi:hypothetical protein
MYALKVQINDEAPVIAGADDLGVLNATVTCVGTLASGGHPGHADEFVDLFITVGGLTARDSSVPNKHVNWISQKPLRIGDLISIQILDTFDVEAPIREHDAGK